MMMQLVNQPVVREGMTPAELQLRSNAQHHLTIARDLGLFPFADVDQAFVFQDGISSVVCKLTSTSRESCVVKLNPYPEALRREAHFYAAWRRHGIQTPEVLRFHPANGDLTVDVLILSYVDAANLQLAVEPNGLIKCGIARQMGQVLARLHQATGAGFGEPKLDNLSEGQFSTLTEEMQHLKVLEQAMVLAEQRLVDASVADWVTQAIATLQLDIAAGQPPVLAHNDFRPPNLLATTPLTVKDPLPRISHPYLCLAKMLIKALTDHKSDPPGGQAELQEHLKGYTSVSLVREDALDAAMIIEGVQIAYLHWQRGRDKKARIAADVVKECTLALDY